MTMLEQVLGWSRTQRLRQAFGLKPQPKPCCRDESNLGAPERVHPDRADATFRRCRVCSCRHFTLEVDPGKLGVIGGNLGVEG